MEKLDGIFIGFKSFQSKKGTACFVLSFLFIDFDDEKNQATYFVKDLFVSQEKYSDVISESQLLSTVPLKREVFGDTVKFSIA